MQMGIRSQDFQCFPTTFQTSPRALKAPQKMAQASFITFSISPPDISVNLKDEISKGK